MFLANKGKAFCVELGEHSVLVARLNQAEAPMVIEELKELPAADTDGLRDLMKAMEGRGPTGYAHSTCGIYPARRMVRRQTLDLKRVKEPAYFNEILSQQFRIEPEKYTVMVLNSGDGSEYDGAKGTLKEVLFCGLPAEEIVATQDRLLELGIYPERLEMGTVATMGALASYLKFKQSKAAILILEIGADATQSFIVSADGVDISRPIPTGIAAMIPVVQKELTLKDEESAKKLFYSNTFDFTSMGAKLIGKLLKELQASIGFYEVQTGQSISSVLCTQLPAQLGWLATSMANELHVDPFKMEAAPWLESLDIRLADGVTLNPPDERWLGLFALAADYNHGVVQPTSDEKK